MSASIDRWMILDYPRHRSTLEYSVSSDKTWSITGSNTHDKQATYVNNLSIYFAWGFEITDNPTLPWRGSKNAIEKRLDFFYGANIVYSAHYYSVDSGRCVVPKPVKEGLDIPSAQHRFFKFFNGLLKKVDQTEYEHITLEVCGFRLLEEAWPGI